MGQKIKVYFLTVLLLLACFLTGCTSSSNNEIDNTQKILVPKVLKDTYVYDQGDFISNDQEDVINNLLIQLEEKTTVEFAVVTIPSLESLTIEEYSVKLARELGLGKADQNNGILLLVSKTDAKVRLEIGTGLQGVLTDSVSGRILDKFFVPSREKENYDDACFNTVNAVINCIAESEEYEFSGINGLDGNIAIEEAEKDELTAAEVIGIIVLIIFLVILEWITGSVFGDGFGDGLVFLILHIILNSRSGGGSGRNGGSFGGGRFNGGGSSR